MRRLRLFVLPALVAFGIVLTVATPPGSRASAAAGGKIVAVHWSLDKPNKQIIVNVKLQFWEQRVCTSTASGFSCVSRAPDPVQISRIVNAILRYWNGHRFKCWDLVVKVDASGIGSQSDASSDAIDISLIDTAVHVTPYVLGTGTGNYLGTSPGDRNTPARQDGVITGEWPIRSTAPDYVYAHEFGHILGLDDNYNSDTGQLLPGATPDLMYGQTDESRSVSEDMITRAVLRSGLPTDEITCPMTGEGGPSHLNLLLATLDLTSVHLYTCDYDPPTTDPKHKPKPMSWKGTIAFGGSYLTQISVPGLPGAAGSTTVSIAFTAEVPANGPGVLKVPFVGGEDIEIPVTWDASGKLRSTDAARLSVSGQSLSTAYFFPGPPLYEAFTSVASECPK
jgi:hypothetical protein